MQTVEKFSNLSDGGCVIDRRYLVGIFSARPPLSIDRYFGGDVFLDYCELPKLDGSGKDAKDIAKGNTPGCGYSHFRFTFFGIAPNPAPNAADLRGLWRVFPATSVIERVEQCSARVGTSADHPCSGPNSTGGYNTNDTEGQVVFTLGGDCPRPPGMFGTMAF